MPHVPLKPLSALPTPPLACTGSGALPGWGRDRSSLLGSFLLPASPRKHPLPSLTIVDDLEPLLAPIPQLLPGEP